MKKIYTILITLVWLCFSNVACDRVFHDHYYLRNSLDEPIQYVLMTGTGEIRGDIITINPGESKEILDLSDMGGSDFDNNSDLCSNFFDMPFFHTITFADSTLLKWERIPINITFEKHPLYKKYWTIIKETGGKRKSYSVQYTIDEEDYQNALSQQ